MQHRPRKQFGQNFLIDDVIIREIIKVIAPKPNQEIIEIGSGLGAITADLLANCKRLVAIEIDHDLSAILHQRFQQQVLEHKLVIINRDILQVDLLQLPLRSLGLMNSDSNNINIDQQLPNPTKKLRITGNLPYNISSPLLFKLFNYSQYIADLNFLLQKEFAARLIAQPHTKEYGKLSIMAQYYANINIIFNVPATAFNPVPKVESSMVQLIPHNNLPYVANNYEKFSSLVAAAFAQRRKVLSNSLKNYCTSSHLQSLGIDPKGRAEQLTVADFVMISNSLTMDNT